MKRFFVSLWYTTLALLTLYGAVALGNYTATQGSGTTFGSIIVSTVHYAQTLICDQVAPSQCAGVDASNNLKVIATGVAQGSTTSGQTQSLLGCAILTAAPTYTTAQTSPVNCDVNGGVRLASSYPAGATPITASATGTTGATTATLAGTSGKTTYICGYSIRANATGAATVTNTITGVITATLSSIMWVAPLASGIGIDEQIFSPCIPASGTNTGIAIVSGAPGSGGTVSSKGWGYQL